MAKFTTHASLKLPINGEKISSWGDPKDPLHFRYGGLRFVENLVQKKHRRCVRFDGCGRICSLGQKSSSFKAEECLGDGDGASLDDDDYDEDGYERDELSCFRGPVNVVCWRRAICLEFMEKADVLEYYDQTVSSPQGSYYIPAVLRVTACSRCNSRKGQKKPEEVNMKLIKVPKIPKDYDVVTIPLTSVTIRMLRMRKGVPDEWRQYLSKSFSEQ
ncbi:hypothetical protein QJS04_geneDACA013014 [Acorus gramineus]|uniref:Uncharacterized protein n=1 Tax=Acorus gramineus TaxID=55184 RepID=A0AAV9B512_ACOGR|nr:hypothetical protein QJS04_geneDACA013014 [Acorus gramineus]